MKTTIIKYFIYKFYLAEQWFNHQNCEVGYQKAAVSTLLYCRMSLDDWLCQPISWSLGGIYCTCPVMVYTILYMPSHGPPFQMCHQTAQ